MRAGRSHGLVVAFSLRLRRFWIARTNLRALRALGFRRHRVFPWMLRSRLVFRPDDEAAIDHDHPASCSAAGLDRLVDVETCGVVR